MQISLDLRVSDLALFHVRSFLANNSVRATGAAALALVAAIVVQVNRDAGISAALMSLSGVFGLILLVAAMFYLLLVAMIASNAQENSELGKMIYSIDANGISLFDGSESILYEWGRITDAGRDSSTIWVHVDDNQFRIFPRRFFSTDLQFEQLWNLVRQHRPAA